MLDQLACNRFPSDNTEWITSVLLVCSRQVLHLASAQRTLDNIPTDLDKLERLVDLDLSDNALTRVPEPVLTVRSHYFRLL